MLWKREEQTAREGKGREEEGFNLEVNVQLLTRLSMQSLSLLSERRFSLRASLARFTGNSRVKEEATGRIHSERTEAEV